MRRSQRLQGQAAAAHNAQLGQLVQQCSVWCGEEDSVVEANPIWAGLAFLSDSSDDSDSGGDSNSDSSNTNAGISNHCDDWGSRSSLIAVPDECRIVYDSMD